MLLENGLTGGLVVPNLTIVESPRNENLTMALDVTTPDLFPSCAVTRSQTKSLVVPFSTVLPSEELHIKIPKENLIAAQEQDSTVSRIKHIATEGKN